MSPGAGDRRAARRPDRSVLARRGALRVRDRPASVPGQDLGGDRSPPSSTARRSRRSRINPELPLRLQEIINNCLEKDRELRYQSAADLRADLKRLRRDLESGHSWPVRLDDVGPALAHRRGSHAEPGDEHRGQWSCHGRRSRHRQRDAPAWPSPSSPCLPLAPTACGAAWRLPPPATEAPVTTLSDAAIESRLSLARSSLNGRNYRAAMPYAASVLAVDAGHAEATRIRDEAREHARALRRSRGQGTRGLAAGDVRARPAASKRLAPSTPPRPLSSSCRRDCRRSHASARPPRVAPRRASSRRRRPRRPDHGRSGHRPASRPRHHRPPLLLRPAIDAPFPATAPPPPPAPAPAAAARTLAARAGANGHHPARGTAAEHAVAARRRRDPEPPAATPSRDEADERRFAASWRRMDAPSRPRTWRSSGRSSRTCPPTRSAGCSRGSAR